MVGSTISHYKIIRKLGEGGMGVVYEAEDLRLGRRAALKFLSTRRLTGDQNRERFLREARSAAALNHPNICTVYEVDEHEGQLFIAMEYCDGLTLRDVIQKGPVDWAVAVSIVIQVAEALAEAHRRQMVHRDIKSANIMVDARNRARLLDFGLASFEGPSDATMTMECVGTPAYMAPERFDPGGGDARGDIWALGVVLYEAITRRMPFAAERATLAYAILNDDPPPPSSLRSGLPPELDDIIDKALAKEPEERYQRVEDLATDLILVLRSTQRDVSPVRSSRVTPASGLELSAGRLSAEGERMHAVAVLPFVNMSHNPEDDFLADGLTEEIANALTQVRGLHVVSRASTFQFRSPSLDLREVGRKLRVRALVLGSVRHQGERVRVNAQLVRASNSYQIWSQRFDCEMRAVFDLEDEVTRAIVEQLRQWLGMDLEPARLHGSTSDFLAHELYLRGRYSFHLQTPRGVADALGLYSQALELAPQYALAHVGMADCYALQGWYGIEPAVEIMPKAKVELETALAIDEVLPSAWCLRAAITAGFDWNWDAAHGYFQKAFSLGPSTSDLHFHHALDFLTPLGRLEEAFEEMKLALELDPAAPLLSTGVGGCLYRLRRYPAALRQLQSTLELAPGFYHGHWTMARVYEAQGQFAEAMECFGRALAASGDNPAVQADAGHCRGAMGDAAGARQILSQVAGVPLASAIVHLGLKETDAALEHLQKAVRQRARGLMWLGVDPRFDALRDNQAFRSVMAAVGLPADVSSRRSEKTL